MRARTVRRVTAVQDAARLCSGCGLCAVVCSRRHVGLYQPSRARIRIVTEDPGVDRPVVCGQCDDPACARACPSGAIVAGLGGAAVEQRGACPVNPDLCTGCGACVSACPSGGTWIDPVSNLATKCDLCGGDPRCVAACPLDVLRLVMCPISEGS